MTGRTFKTRTGLSAPGVVPLPAGHPHDPLDQYVLIVRKRFTDVAAPVAEVRNASLAAAFIGLGVALVLGRALATTLTRRLARLRVSALRVTAEGSDAPTPRDERQDEVGDLARALSTMQIGLR